MPDGPRSPSGAPDSGGADARCLRQLASEMILSASNLTDELTDDESRSLIDWGVTQAEAAADDLLRASQDERDPVGRDLGDALGDRLEAVRKIMKRLNGLVAHRRDMPAEELFEELQRLSALAEELPRPPSLTVPTVPLAELGARQADLGNQAFVQAIVGLLEDSPCGGDQERSAQLGIGN